jgi:hypothetical protein
MKVFDELAKATMLPYVLDMRVHGQEIARLVFLDDGTFFKIPIAVTDGGISWMTVLLAL